MWITDEGLAEVTSAFQGITTPTSELLDDIHRRGWTVNKVHVKDEQYVAEGKSPHGEKLEATGRTDSTAIANLLVKVMRREHMRSSSLQEKLGAWDHKPFLSQLSIIAQAYASAPVYEPKAAPAWMDLAQDCERRVAIIRTQVAIEYTDDPVPYETVDELREDVTQKKHVLVSRAYAHHPVWSEQQMCDYRLVVDVLGHTVGGADWGWHGTCLAFAALAPLFADIPQKALFTELLGQSAFGISYRQWGPQKITFLEDLVEKAQEKENKPGHSGVHPSQSIVPGQVPRIFSKVASTVKDPNADWESGIQPLPDAAYLWQRQDGVDPLDIQGVTDNLRELEPGLTNMHPELAKQSVVNALRSSLLGSRKNPMNHAIHYQDLMTMPANVDDPMAYWDALEQRRENWNQGKGYAPHAHRQHWAEEQQFKQWVKAMNPQLDDGEVQRLAKRELVHMLTEEEERILAQDAGEEFTAEQVEHEAYEALRRRLKTLTKSNVDQKVDFGDHYLYHESTYHADMYPPYLASRLRPMAGVSRYADALANAAREDLLSYQGSGHHFRAQALNLGIPQLGPRQISHAWLHLAPQTSQLAVVEPQLMETLGHDYLNDMSNREYFKHERELAAARDVSGYNHVPLGSFSTGLWDLKAGGPGWHPDRTPFKAHAPTPYHTVDWNSQTPSYPNWTEPYWWNSTQEARDQVAQDFDRNVATEYSKEEIPFQKTAMGTLPCPKCGESLNMMATGYYDPIRCPSCGFKSPLGGETRVIGQPITPEERTKAWESLADGPQPEPYVNPKGWNFGIPRQGSVGRFPWVMHPQTGQKVTGAPGTSLMQHLKQTFGYPDVQTAWNQEHELGKV